MVTNIDYPEVQRQMAAGTPIVEVLPAKQYRKQHLPDAVSVPLKTLDAESVARFAQDQAIVVYCYDRQ